MKPFAPELIPITRPLAASRRRLRALASLSGLFRALWTTMAAVLVAGIADYVLHLPWPVRLGMIVLIGLYFLYGLMAWAIRPLFATVTLDAIAARVEKRNPWLQDRLRSALDFESTDVEGSREMQRRVVDETLASMAKVDVAGITDAAPLRKAMLLSVIPLVMFTVLALLAPAYVQIGLQRLFAPMRQTQWPRSVQIELVDKLPDRVPIGQRLEMSARLSRGDRPSRQVMVSWQVGDGAVQQQLMQRNDKGTYDVGIDVRTPASADASTMRVWIQSGDDEIGPLTVGLVPRLQVSDVTADVTPPKYTGLEAMRINLRTEAATVPAGSSVKLTIGFSRSVTTVTLQPVGASEAAALPQIAWTRVSGESFAGSWIAADSLRFRVLAKDENGYPNPAAEEFEIIARPDQQPTVQLETPRKSEERTAESVVPVSALAEDDYGIAAMALEARLLSADPAAAAATSQPVAMSLIENGAPAYDGVKVTKVDSDSRRVRSRVAFDWRLISFPSALLRPGDVIEFQVSAKDTYDFSGQTHPAAKTPPLRITIVSQEQLLQRVYDELRQIASQISEVKTRQDRLRGDTEQLKEDVLGKKAPDATDESVASRIAEQENRAASQTRDAASRLAAIAARLQENASTNKQLQDAAKSAGKLLENAADAAMKPAAGDVKQGVEANSNQERRGAAMEKAGQKQKQASDQLSQALDMLGDVGGIGRAIDMIQELLGKQRESTDQTGKFARDHAGQRPEDLSKEDREKLDKIAQEQGGLAKQTEGTLEQLRSMAARQGSQDQASADALKQAAQTGQEQSVAQHQQKAGEAISQNQSAQASSSQQSAESGLQQMLDSLKDAQKRKLEELAKKLANVQEQIKNLLRRQAGHNLDNLALRNATEGESAELSKELAKAAGREQVAAQGLSATQLAQSQQQTHTNASDLVEQLDKVRGTGEVATHLGKATGRMERAVALLKQEKLLDAYQPPQKEALAELQLALKAISDLKDKTEQQGENDQKEKLRKAYEAIRDQEKQIRDATKLLDQALAGDKKRRSDLVRVAQLSGDQQKLGDMLRPLTKQLEDLGSIIFVRTSDAIGHDMAETASALSQQKTGRPTQMTQTQIIARLEAIIRGLAETKPPDESKYATRSEGGSGEGGQPQRKLPSAAELMLIRDLQAIVNDQTKQLTAEDADVLPLTGEQQGGVRASLDQLVKSVAPEAKLPDAKESRELVPEEKEPAPEAGADTLDEELLTDKPAGGDDKQDNADIDMMAKRMTRSQVRLGENKDPGAVTQLVQAKILKSLDKIIEEARKQQQQPKQQQQQSQQQAQADPNAKPNDQTGKSQQKSSNPAQKSQVTAGAKPPEPTGDIRETAKEWGGLSERDRQAVIESAGEDMIEKYRKMTEDYYRALSIKATENK